MGAGNPKLRSFDEDKFEPTTYFLDLGQDFDETEASLAEENEGIIPEEDEVWAEVNFLSEMNFEDLVESLCSELDLDSHKLDRNNNYPELSSAFRNDGLILCEGKTSYLISETGSEYSHLPIAVIPKFKFETFLEDAEFEMEDKREWYDARGKSVAVAIDKLAEKRWKKEMEKFFEEANVILNTLARWYPTSMSMRNGAWMSGPIDPKKLAA